MSIELAGKLASLIFRALGLDRPLSNPKAETPIAVIPAIKYKVHAVWVNLQFTEREKKGIQDVCETYNETLLSLVAKLLYDKGNSLFTKEPWLPSLAKIVEDKDWWFDYQDPLSSRRDAFRYAHNLNDVIIESGEYNATATISDVTNKYGLAHVLSIFDNNIGIYGLSVCMVHGGKEYSLMSHFPLTTNTVEILEFEYALFQEYGYSSGGAMPFKKYIPELNREMVALPDVCELFRQKV